MTRRAAVFAAVLIAFIGGAGWYVFARTDNARTLHADFTYINGIYAGSKVTVLGVPIGRVTAVTPQGTTVRVSMSLPSDVSLPEDVNAYIMSPALISDRSVDLGPAYTGTGPALVEGQVIPVERSHAPITFDSMLGSLSTLTESLGPDQGDLGQLLSRGADQWRGQGKQFNAAVRNLSSATGVLGARAEDIDAVVGNLNTMMTAFNQRQVSLNDLVNSLGALGDSWADQDLDITGTMTDLRTVLDSVSAVVNEHSEDLGAVAENLNAVGDILTHRQPELAEFMDLVPLMMQNLSNTIGPDRRGRIRLNVSSVLTQFADAHNFCERTQWPICSGIGLVNPIEFPISRSDPLGIVSAVTGVIPPPNPNHPR
ncbi:MCE family protein [Mycolicibacterium confluentis]|uniref:ABC transporter substrate-binding protein n=1 Tax=Mycolicibacterium confluentis TaxID=28047 RepID=A0A7I7Y168_9MYCO|nr:MCE family protein [Mycolicibacterium confluentis]MCV7320300.1 MCE family protein [Mycolicibacterium confluentis]ORV34942.1 virulence factor Mce [Mycolicibacterium confluentis]BBZ35337.1 ABC transporter substrate-binding protein [Mycolicibacterium confluentis]